eukprot:TRINITY_DN548_c0_g1_i1.p1 TRINITY_DN548_c0_g1~~TRINITY_DN548_c0_g1_i1.p1  ORF type:complete len:111 (-),score=23.30 TRINITY_DN548_c0_g1_i1:335-667(-)
MTDEDYVDMSEGRLDGMSAFMQGKLAIDGDMGAAQMFGPAAQRLQEAAEAAQTKLLLQANSNLLLFLTKLLLALLHFLTLLKTSLKTQEKFFSFVLKRMNLRHLRVCIFS